MRPTIVAGNWKMHGSRQSIEHLLNELKQGIRTAGDVELVVFPPFVYLEQVANALKDSGIAWGAQNISSSDSGAYTGEVSCAMLHDFACRYVLVGHSERRAYYGENNSTVADKFAQVKRHGLTPILCVGETLEQRKAEQTEAVISQQIDTVLELEGGVSLLQNAVIAYEPVWAIGTGVTATPAQAQQVHELIRQQIAQHDAEIAQALPILYGGSVKPDNARQLFEMTDIDGALVGGASLKATDFLEIAKR